ncbi:GNAT family N-acetyltransferase [Sphingomonas sp. ASV193]|uniref:GNAT family N-acetyltransferase n=1 Tax=Sphingomonas sp. ASV193 TaxID=3144405 RepID=UPI0032E8CC80
MKMFARTERLLLRPGFAEDASALARAIADEQVCRNMSSPPWPYGVQEAQAFLAAPADPALPRCLVFLRTGGAPELIGGVGLQRRPSGAVELGYWIARAHWGKGYATEATRAVIDMARMLRLPRIEAAHFIDNPASANVLAKLGFRPTGLSAPRHSCARGGEAMTRLYRLKLCEALGGEPAPLAA